MEAGVNTPLTRQSDLAADASLSTDGSATQQPTQQHLWTSEAWSFDAYKFQPQSKAGKKKSGVRNSHQGSTLCQVDGCNTETVHLKEYHRRYKICEHHLKVSDIIIEGISQRFCQQCGRFHPLSKFDLNKRSCRERLQKHNARRRKEKAEVVAAQVVFASLPSAPSKVPNGTSYTAEVAKESVTALHINACQPYVDALTVRPAAANNGACVGSGATSATAPTVAKHAVTSQLLALLNACQSTCQSSQASQVHKDKLLAAITQLTALLSDAKAVAALQEATGLQPLETANQSGPASQLNASQLAAALAAVGGVDALASITQLAGGMSTILGPSAPASPETVAAAAKTTASGNQGTVAIAVSAAAGDNCGSPSSTAGPKPLPPLALAEATSLRSSQEIAAVMTDLSSRSLSGPAPVAQEDHKRARRDVGASATSRSLISNAHSQEASSCVHDSSGGAAEPTSQGRQQPPETQVASDWLTPNAAMVQAAVTEWLSSVSTPPHKNQSTSEHSLRERHAAGGEEPYFVLPTMASLISSNLQNNTNSMADDVKLSKEAAAQALQWSNSISQQAGDSMDLDIPGGNAQLQDDAAAHATRGYKHTCTPTILDGIHLGQTLAEPWRVGISGCMQMRADPHSSDPMIMESLPPSCETLPDLSLDQCSPAPQPYIQFKTEPTIARTDVFSLSLPEYLIKELGPSLSANGCSKHVFGPDRAHLLPECQQFWRQSPLSSAWNDHGPPMNQESSVEIQIAKDLLYGGQGQPYTAAERVVSLSLKLYNATPSNLPLNMRQHLLKVVYGGLLSEAFLREGCVHLTLDTYISTSALKDGAVAVSAMQVLQQLQGQDEFWHQEGVKVQWLSTTAIKQRGEVRDTTSDVDRNATFAAHPFCLSHSEFKRQDVQLMLQGSGNFPSRLDLSIRSRGTYYPIDDGSITTTVRGSRLYATFRCSADVLPSCLRVELSSDGICHWCPLLIVEDEAMATEIRNLRLQPVGDGAMLDLLLDLGRCLELSWWLQNYHQLSLAAHEVPIRHYTAEEVRSTVLAARALAAYAALNGMIATLRCLMPLVAVGCQTAVEVLDAVKKANQDDSTLLYQAVASRNIEMVNFVLDWASRHGGGLQIEACSPTRLTSLHLAALLNDNGFIAERLSREVEGAAMAWVTVTSASGATPCDFARWTGHVMADYLVRRNVTDEDLQKLSVMQAANAAVQQEVEVQTSSKKPRRSSGPQQPPDVCKTCKLPASFHGGRNGRSCPKMAVNADSDPQVISTFTLLILLGIFCIMAVAASLLIRFSV